MLAQQQQTCLGGAMHISLPLHPISFVICKFLLDWVDPIFLL
jgi:hypothetical protein